MATETSFPKTEEEATVRMREMLDSGYEPPFFFPRENVEVAIRFPREWRKAGASVLRAVTTQFSSWLGTYQIDQNAKTWLEKLEFPFEIAE